MSTSFQPAPGAHPLVWHRVPDGISADRRECPVCNCPRKLLFFSKQRHRAVVDPSTGATAWQKKIEGLPPNPNRRISLIGPTPENLLDKLRAAAAIATCGHPRATTARMVGLKTRTLAGLIKKNREFWRAELLRAKTAAAMLTDAAAVEGDGAPVTQTELQEPKDVAPQPDAAVEGDGAPVTQTELQEPKDVVPRPDAAVEGDGAPVTQTELQEPKVTGPRPGRAAAVTLARNSAGKAARKHSKPPSQVPAWPTATPALATVRAFAHARYEPEILPGPSHLETRRLVEVALNHLQRFCGRDPTLDEIVRPLIKRFLTWMVTPASHRELYQGRLLPPSPHNAPATANKNLRHILAVVRYAAEEEVIRPLPRIRLLKVPRPRVWSWNPRQVGAMLAAAEVLDGDMYGVPARLWWTALILVLYDTGARISAVMALRWHDFSLADLGVFLRAQTQKQGQDQYLGISSQTATAVDAIRGDRSEIFTWPFDRHCTRKTWKTLRGHFRRMILRPAGIEDVTGKCLHRFRATNATQLKKHGGNATEQLGHSSSRVTEAYLDGHELGPSRQVDFLIRPERLRPILPEPRPGDQFAPLTPPEIDAQIDELRKKLESLERMRCPAAFTAGEQDKHDDPEQPEAKAT